jgi:hypothetical protein
MHKLHNKYRIDYICDYCKFPDISMYFYITNQKRPAEKNVHQCLLVEGQQKRYFGL